MKDNYLRNKIKEIIKKKISESEDKDITKEGVVSSVFDHISNVLKKSRDKRFQKSLDSISKSSSQGKKAVDDFVKMSNDLEDSADVVMDLAAKERENW